MKRDFLAQSFNKKFQKFDQSLILSGGYNSGFKFLENEKNEKSIDLDCLILELWYKPVASIMEQCAEEGLVRKESVEKKELAGIKNTYALSEEGRAFFEDLLGTRPGETDKTPAMDEKPLSPDLDLLNDLVLEIPEFLTDVGVKFDRAQHEQFQRKVTAFFERKGLRTGR